MKCVNGCAGNMEIEEEQVDIGVGVQTFIVGARCPICDFTAVPCSTCGFWNTENPPHASWCELVKSGALDSPEF